MAAKIYDVKAHRAALLANPTYVARPDFVRGLGWKEEPTGGHSLYLVAENSDTPDQHGYLTQVGWVLPNKYFCGRGGSWSERYGKAFTTAKYGFLLGRPNEYPLLGADWDASLLTASAIQKDIAPDGNCKYWVVDENGAKAMKMGMKCFEKKGGDTACKPAFVVAFISLSNKRPSAGNHLAAIAGTHDVCLLPLYDIDETLVPEALIEKKLRGALVEVTYKLMHYTINTDGEITESFSAEIQQIIIKAYGKTQPSGPFRRAARPLVFKPISAVVPPPTAGCSNANDGNSAQQNPGANSGKSVEGNGGKADDGASASNRKRLGEELVNPIAKKS
ncbi:hypothetical protein R3P38DRAFT_3229684 [Favolaschia claudopus]|uniref:Uncharacterized protein n=1 Tax=Favolaschia claudopus TaxID=2862362 RepID=A0AAV9ZNQ3_9AGAR